MKPQEIRDLIRYLTGLLASMRPKPKPRPKVKPKPNPNGAISRFGVDYAWGSPSIRALRSAGVSFVCRYLSLEGNSKNLRPTEAKALHANHIAIVTVWETTAERARAGRRAGEVDAGLADRMLRKCGMAGAVVYFAVDFDATNVLVGDYFRGASHVLGVHRTGVYGGYAAVKRLLSAGLVKYAWQTYAWSGGAWDHRAQLRQFSNDHTIGGVSCDFDRAVMRDFGQWGG